MVEPDCFFFSVLLVNKLGTFLYTVYIIHHSFCTKLLGGKGMVGSGKMGVCACVCGITVP